MFHCVVALNLVWVFNSFSPFWKGVYLRYCKLIYCGLRRLQLIRQDPSRENVGLPKVHPLVDKQYENHERDGLFMQWFDIVCVDWKCHIRMCGGWLFSAEQANLSQSDYLVRQTSLSTHIHDHLEAEQLNVELKAFIDQLSYDVWYYSSNVH